MGIPVLLGRGFTQQDVTPAQQVAVVNQTLVRQFFNGQNPVGKRFAQTTTVSPIANGFRSSAS